MKTYRKRAAGNPFGAIVDANPEDTLQHELVAFHASAVPQDEAILFAVPNGEKRDPITAARLSGISAANRDLMPEDQALRPAGQGVLPGVSDLIVLLKGGRTLLVEVKIPVITVPPSWVKLAAGAVRTVLHKAGVLSKAQRRFREGASKLGHEYWVVRTLEDYADLLERFGVRLRCRPAGPGIIWRAPIGDSV